MSASRPSARAATWEQVAAVAQQRLAATFGRPAGASGLALHPTSAAVAATTPVRDSLLDGGRVVVTVFEDGVARTVREGWSPAWSPDGRTLAHLDATGVQVGDWHRAITGVTEHLAWRPDGSALLLVVADRGSELSGLLGSGLIAPAEDAEAWLPSVASSEGHAHWRRLLVLDVTSGALTPVGRDDLNIWSACWAGDRVLALTSDGSSSESAWYTADLRLLDVTTGADEVVAVPTDQVGALTASPSGRRLAWVESICSDRDLVAGDLRLLDLDTGLTVRLAAPTDVSDAAFTSEDELGFAGLEGMTTRIGSVTVEGEVRTAWESLEATAAGAHPSASSTAGRTAFLRVGDRVLPEVVLLEDGGETVLATLLDEAPALPGTSRVHRWTAPDGLEVEGWLHLPAGPGPHPLVVLVHGGPVASHRSSWAPLALLRPLLLEQGYALLLPNPRGSSGRGQEFARMVVGDMGGADAQDVLSGVASLVGTGLVDPARVGVTGGSYGGFLSAWLITQTDLFAAAVPQYPITDWVQQHGVSCIPFWDELFLDGKPYARDGQYVERSPLTHVAAVRTPTLFLCGALDRATPSGQALTMHRALQAHGVPTECITYPHATHGVRDMASVIDTTARTLAWFERFMPSTTPLEKERT